MTTPLEKTIQQASSAFEGVFQTQEAERERRQKEALAAAAARPLTFGDVLREKFSDLPWAEVLRQRKLVGWEVERFVSELKVEGWRDRWNAELTENIAARARKDTEERIHKALTDGPQALATWDESRLVALIKNPKLREIAGNYEPGQGGLLVLGPTGIGKSVALIVILKRRMYDREVERLSKPRTEEEPDPSYGWTIGHSETHRPEAWVRAFDLPNARLQHGLGDGEAQLVQVASNAGFLVLDDMGWESKRAGADDVVSEVIGTRYDRGAVTVVTSGQRLDAFIARYGDAVVRRIVECDGKPGRVIDAWPKDKP